ncbi:MAG: riboflavin biosynthesis protein RibF [Candidatus Omnitrophica bacterium]|nr:riboflavin biosynthesis protein RibF [Candidatus Omnitrophota bacterium]
MPVIIGRNRLPAMPPRAVVTIGMFDGVHRAHQRLIRTAVRLARRLRGTSVAVTFDPDPQLVLDPRHAPPPLMPLARRLKLIEDLGAHLIWVIRFTPAFSRISPDEFIRSLLWRQLRARWVVVGDAFAFGKDRRGDLSLLRRGGSSYGMRIMALPAVRSGDAPISSSRIRRLVQHGALAEARQLLGRHVELSGRVVHGVGRASRLGFPTANIKLHATLLPPHGVYRVVTSLRGRRHEGLMNLGTRPTFGRGGGVVCEVHLPRFRGQLYGHTVTLSLLEYLRRERRFTDRDALIRQIRRDLRRVKLLP